MREKIHKTNTIFVFYTVRERMIHMHKRLQIPIITIIFTLVFSLLMPTTAYAASNKSKIRTIQKARPKITMAATDTKITVKSNKAKYATKYQFKYSTNKNFKSAKTVTKTSRTFKLNTVENKNYYVKVRAVARIKNKNYYSKWSKVKVKIITKKAYDKTIVDEKEWWETQTVFNYDGYKPTSSADSTAHKIMLADAGCDPSWTTEPVYHPAVTHVTHIKAEYKIVTM